MQRRKPIPEVQKTRSRSLRKNSTFPERLLWGSLRAGRLAGLKFRRQHPMEGYVLDFYCHEAQLAIELDGKSHEGRATYDAVRTARLQQLGIRVLRVDNDDVLNDLNAVLERILRECGKANS